MMNAELPELVPIAARQFFRDSSFIIHRSSFPQMPLAISVTFRYINGGKSDGTV